jgi:hypothetical protein
MTVEMSGQMPRVDPNYYECDNGLQRGVDEGEVARRTGGEDDDGERADVGERRAPGQPVAFVGRSFPGCLHASGRTTFSAGIPSSWANRAPLQFRVPDPQDAGTRPSKRTKDCLPNKDYATVLLQNMAAHRTVGLHC